MARSEREKSLRPRQLALPTLLFLGCNDCGRRPAGLWGEVAQLAQAQPMGPSLRRLLQPGVSRTRAVGVRAKAHQHAAAGRNQVSLWAVPGLSLELGARTQDQQALPPLILSY